MPEQRLTLEPGQKPRLRLEWGGYYREFKVFLDDALIGEIEGGQKALKAGHDFTLPDGTVLSVKLRQTNVLDELQVLRDGRPLPGSATDPVNRLRAAVTTVSLWGMLDIALGTLALIFANDFMLSLGGGWHAYVFGVLLLAAAAMMGSGRRWAFAAAVAVYVVDAIVGFTLAGQAGVRPNSAAILARLLFLAPLVRALPHLDRLKLQ